MGKRQALNFVSVGKQRPLGDACCPEPDREAWCFAIRSGEWGRGARLCLSLCPTMGAVVVLRSRFCFLCIPVTRSVCRWGWVPRGTRLPGACCGPRVRPALGGLCLGPQGLGRADTAAEPWRDVLGARHRREP